jgi:hypothetical protein
MCIKYLHISIAYVHCISIPMKEGALARRAGAWGGGAGQCRYKL